jgi:hypothetical protein
MVRQINPGLARLYLDSKTRQYGYRNPLVLTDLSPGAQRTLDFLEQGIADQQLSLLPKMANANPTEVNDLVDRLGGYLRQTSSMFPELDQAQVQTRFREILRLFASTSLDPAQALKSRKRARVFLSALSPFGFTLARAMAAAGVGTLITDDQKRVADSDLGPLGFPFSVLGKPRATAARDLLLGEIEIQHHSRITPSYDRMDVAILIGSDVLSPRIYQRWLSRDIPHIRVIFDEGGVEISHLVIPGITPCLGCLELARLRENDSWQSVATQLDYLERDLADSASSLFGASIALTRTLERIDDPLPKAAVNTIRFDRSSGVCELQLNQENCGCR